jgi:hypothetical protein
MGAKAGMEEPFKLNLRKLEDIRRLLQYGAILVFLVFLGLITFSYFQWRKIERQIAVQRETLKQQEQDIKQNQEKIEAQKSVLDGFATVVRESPRPYTQSAEQRTVDTIELSIPKDVNTRLVPARVYFHITREDQRRRAAEVAPQLQANGYLVPRIEYVGRKAFGPTQLRYCSSDDTVKRDLDNITNLFAKLSIKIKPLLIRDCGNVRPRHYEIWFGDEF